jgi:hypothetical protein
MVWRTPLMRYLIFAQDTHKLVSVGLMFPYQLESPSTALPLKGKIEPAVVPTSLSKA